MPLTATYLSVYTWQVEIIIWQVDIIIWQVDIMIWQVDMITKKSYFQTIMLTCQMLCQIVR